MFAKWQGVYCAYAEKCSSPAAALHIHHEKLPSETELIRPSTTPIITCRDLFNPLLLHLSQTPSHPPLALSLPDISSICPNPPNLSLAARSSVYLRLGAELNWNSRKHQHHALAPLKSFLSNISISKKSVNLLSAYHPSCK